MDEYGTELAHEAERSPDDKWTEASRHRRSWSRSIGFPLLALAVFAALLGSCGNSGSDGSGGAEPTANVTDSGELVSVDEAAPSLTFLGDLARPFADPVTADFDTAGGDMELADGTRVRVGPDTFTESTSVTAVVVDLALDEYLGSDTWSRAYVVSAPDGLDLGQPVILEVPRAPADARVVQLVQGEWQQIDAGAGSTLEVPITHFSEVPTLIAEVGDDLPALPPGVDEDSPADFLTACIAVLTQLFTRPGENLSESLGLQLAYSLCTRALIDRLAPNGVAVSTECVGDRIGGDIDIEAVVMACAGSGNADVTTDPPSEAPSVEADDTTDTGDGPEDVVFADGVYEAVPLEPFPGPDLSDPNTEAWLDATLRVTIDNGTAEIELESLYYRSRIIPGVDFSKPVGWGTDPCVGVIRQISIAEDPEIRADSITASQFRIVSLGYDSLEGEACEKPARPDFLLDLPGDAEGMTFDMPTEILPSTDETAIADYGGFWSFPLPGIVRTE